MSSLHTPQRGTGSFLLSLLAGVIISMLVLSACLPATASPGVPTSSIVTIGVSLSLTGENAADGRATLQGYHLWVAQVNRHGGLLGHPVQLLIYDDGTRLNQTQINYETLISIDHVAFVLGPFGGNATAVGAEVAARHGYAFVEGIGTVPSIFPHGLTTVFGVSLALSNYLASFVASVLSLPAAERPTSVAYVSSDDPGTQPAIDRARTLFEASGIKTVLYESERSSPAETDLLVAQKVVTAAADVVILGRTAMGDAVFFRAFLQQHYNPKLLLVTAGADRGSMFPSMIGRKNMEGVMVSNGSWWPETKAYQNAEFISSYRATYGGTPDAIGSDTVQAFSVGQVLQQAVNRAQSLDNAQVIHALWTGAFQSLQGPVRFASSGENAAGIAFLLQWQGGKLIPVFPTEWGQATMEYPKPMWATIGSST
ncbi:MAG: amino acid ABC transporter substrate-binding protein [Ktedonobacteraceae bacterium]|nr:amino acid ABC transporter substrate-binding protein [Ktedonobacteraceae bacterium]